MFVRDRYVRRPGLREAATLLVIGWVATIGVAAAEQEQAAPDAKLENLFIEELGEGAYLGVQLEEETDSPEGGARVTRVVDDSPAATAGLRRGDIVVGFDGETIRGPVAMTKRIHAKQPGDRVTIVVLRDGRRQTLEAELGERSLVWRQLGEEGKLFMAPEFPERLERSLEKLRVEPRLEYLFECEDDEDCEPTELGRGAWGLTWLGRPVLGVQLVEVTAELREHLGASRDTGVLVSKVLSGTPAENAGIRVGDLIVAVAGQAVADSGDLRRELADKRGKTFDVDVVRDGVSRTITVTIPEPDDDLPTGPRAHSGARSAPLAEAYALRSAAAREARLAAYRAAVDAFREAREQVREAAGAARSRAADEARRQYRRALVLSRLTLI